MNALKVYQIIMSIMDLIMDKFTFALKKYYECIENLIKIYYDDYQYNKART